MSNPGPYPIPSETVITSGGVEVAGPQYTKYHRFQPDYESVVDAHVYEDGGASYVSRNDVAPIIFLFEYANNLLSEESDVLDYHRATAFGPLYGFELTDPRTGEIFQDVHYLEWSEDHRIIQTFNERVVRLIKRP